MKEWKHKCELKLLMCQPNPLRPDRVTVGLVLRDTNSACPRVEVRIAPNLRAVRCIYPDADIEAMQGTLNDLESVLKNVIDVEQHLLNLPADFPIELELLSQGAVLTESIDLEIALLEKQYLQPLKLSGLEDQNDTREPIDYGRPYLLKTMQQSYRKSGALDFLQIHIPIDKYTFPEDPLKIDFGYLSNDKSTYRMLHATSVVLDLDKAKILALSWPFIRDGIQKAKHRKCQMTAVIEAAHHQQSEKSKAAMNWLQESGITLRPVSEVTRMAEEARQHLNL